MDISGESTRTIIYPRRAEQDPVNNPFRETMMHIYVKETNQKLLIGKQNQHTL